MRLFTIADMKSEILEMNTVEIVSKPPELIGLTFLHPTNNNFVTVDIFIALNGQLRVSISTNPSDKAPCSNEYVQKLLEASQHIPLALTYILKQRS